jgi:hypothetical protein
MVRRCLLVQRLLLWVGCILIYLLVTVRVWPGWVVLSLRVSYYGLAAVNGIV